MRKPLNLKDLGKTGKPAIPPTPFEQGLSGNSRSFSATPPTVTNPNPQDVFAPRSLPPTITKPTREDAFNPDAQAPVVDFNRTAVEPPRINAKPWQIAAQNWRAKQAKELGVGDITRDRNSTVAETASQFMIERDALMKQLDPQTARIEAAKQALEALFAQRPELAEQAKLMFPNEAQLGVAGLAALLQPGRAFESLAQPFQFQQQEQARTQALNNQQFASDREEWGMMYQRAVSDVNSEYDFEQNRQANAIKNIQSFDDLTADLNSQEQQNFRAQLSANSEYTLRQLKGAQDFARAEMQQVAATQRELMKSPEQVAARIQARLIEGGMDAQTASQIAWAEVQSDYFKNLDLQSRIDERAKLLPIKVQQGIMGIAKTQADIDYINSRIDYTNVLAQKVGEDFALSMMRYGLDVQKFNQGVSQNAVEYDLQAAEALLRSQSARVKIVADQLEQAQKQATSIKEGTPERAAADAGVYKLRAELAATNRDVNAAVKAIEAITKKPVQNPDGQVNLTFGTVPGGAANSGGRFRPQQVEAATKNVVCRSGAQCAEGLTQALQNLGFNIPTMLGAQQTAQWAIRNGGQVVTDPQPGDIVWVQGPGYGGVQAGGRRSGHHVEMYAGNGYVWNRRNGRWTKDRAGRHTNAKSVTYIRLPQ